jgi:5-deoxy-glucuronate isomerase
MSSSATELGATSCVVRRTDSKEGRTAWLRPGTSPLEHLHYGRIILRASGEATRFANPGQETGLICLKGKAIIETLGERFHLGVYDALYVPRGAEISVAPHGTDGCDVAEFSAPVENLYPLKFVRFRDVQADPGLHFKPGEENCKRDLNILIGKNVQAGRIVAGVTFRGCLRSFGGHFAGNQCGFRKTGECRKINMPQM